jgi:hypothetical protein
MKTEGNKGMGWRKGGGRVKKKDKNVQGRNSKSLG